ncbi:hypothetical protein IAQ61_011123 [Plenodomus lingam]|uniref:Predicted protein n=1 Tax=Leptosphaeria maculans (strain JN3 / isolate v23.1.3 / race Av1-4-5-6-7-8) TaxID=985895 RepID=E5A948_LEPMJ|nr:predicted protein [Plenodomus lingam JN3]KAH9859342.1 hypothetical protein IAQ61_011123 [Plenodomus lingam]CBY00189.1 predicted protein [Plenodomus lingam JN3]
MYRRPPPLILRARLRSSASLVPAHSAACTCHLQQMHLPPATMHLPRGAGGDFYMFKIWKSR